MMRGVFKHTSLLLLLLHLSFCAQSRRGNAPDTPSEVWGAQELCNGSETGEELRCFSIEPNISENFATITITKLDFDPSQAPYRLVARPAGFTTWHVLAEQLSIPEGGSFEVDAQAGVFIEEYEEFLMETTDNISVDVVSGMSEVAPGLGIPLVWGYVDYPELYEIPDEGSTASSQRRP